MTCRPKWPRNTTALYYVCPFERGERVVTCGHTLGRGGRSEPRTSQGLTIYHSLIEDKHIYHHVRDCGHTELLRTEGLMDCKILGGAGSF